MRKAPTTKNPAPTASLARLQDARSALKEIACLVGEHAADIAALMELLEASTGDKPAFARVARMVRFRATEHDDDIGVWITEALAVLDAAISAGVSHD
ncbi:hypothetical protein [Paraburkholderia adhaesiva]|uniref:hypothetical protein n=1 Tax=Paraburkholderia adhaesiva TaxID=2883244 RepID=UPI001F1C9196|nr:hypothetical protein [Paraburkholderia adhaesiva]